MKRLALIANPKAGRGGFERVREHLIRIAHANGFAADVSLTTAEADSPRLLAERASQSCDLLIACGGDGTVHGVLQGVAGKPTALGVLPFGTANALARNLRLPLDPVLALEKLLTYEPVGIPLGVAETTEGTRWFTVMAGAGPDGSLVHEMRLATKARAGRRAYYSEAARLFMTRRFAQFRVEYRTVGAASWSEQQAVGVMASRIPDLGGLFSGLTRASRLHHPHLLVQLLRAPAHLALPAWIAFSRAGLERRNPWLTTLAVEEIRCTPIPGAPPVLTQVDGEAAAPLPFSARVIADGVRLLMPR